MAVIPGVWGIDLGQCALKAIRMENIEGQWTATAFDYVEHPKILSQPDADPDQLTREALEKFLSRNSLRGDVVAISIPGQSGLARFVKLPPVEEKKIPDIVRFEAKQQIPFNLEEVVWDYQKLNSGVVTDGFAMETEIGLFAIKRDTVAKYLQHFKEVDVEVHVVQMAPLALCNYLSFDLLQRDPDKPSEEAPAGRKKCIVALDIGADNSNLVITDGERIIWQRPIPLGGNHFTRALTKDMKLTFAKAEHLKRNATKSPELKQILGSLKPVLNDFVGEVQRSLGYFTNTHRDANIQFLMGLGNAFRLPGLHKFLGEKLQLDVRKLTKLERLVGDDVINAPVYTENVLSFAVAYGLALQGLKAARLQTNLLPQEIRVERMIRAKKPWAVTAAASLLIGTATLAIGYNRQHVAVGSTIVKDQIKAGDGVLGKARRFENAVTEVLGQIEKDKNGVKSIIVGQDERLNWIQFNQFVNRAFPKPDGSNLNEAPTKPDNQSAKNLFWTGLARSAYQKFLGQQRGTAKASDRLDEEEWRDDLVHANVESIYCVFSDNLEQYFSTLKSGEVRMNTMNEKDRATPPTGKGWVVEVRGYTYHKGGYMFVTKAIVENLARMPIIVGPEKAATSGASTADKPASPPPPAAGNQGSTHTTASGTDGAAAGASSNQVSHVVLYNYRTTDEFEPGVFAIIDSRVVDSLVSSSGAPAQKAGANSPAGGSSNWSPLGSDGTGSGGGSGLPGGGKPMTGMAGGRGASTMGPSGGMQQGMQNSMQQQMQRGGNMPGAKRPGGGGGAGLEGSVGPGAPTGGETHAVKKKGRHFRTEFVILFVWREPTAASDKLLEELVK